MSFRAPLLVALILLAPTVLPLTAGEAADAAWNPNGLKHVAWQPLQPVSAATFVGFDPESYRDDYAYLAAVPTSVYTAGGSLYASPLLYWEPPLPDGTPDEQLSLNAYQSNYYLMEDWMTYTEGNLDRMQLLELDTDVENELRATYPADRVFVQNGGPSETAAELALANWAYADEAVVAVIDDSFPTPPEAVTGSVSGTAPGGPVEYLVITGDKLPDPVNPNIHPFEVQEGYRYVDAYMEWTWFGQQVAPDGSAVTERGKDLDLQLYDPINGEVVASEFWNVVEGDLYRPHDPPYEQADTYAYNEGIWGAYVTYMPTKGFTALGSEAPAAPQADEDSRAYYTIYIDTYTGIDVVLPKPAPMMTGPTEFTLAWEGGQNLGLIIRDPSEAAMAQDLSNANPKTITFTDLGEGVYSASVISLDGDGPVDFDISYSYEPMMHRDGAKALTSAANGAVWASLHNAPLLYATPDGMPDVTSDALNELGVEKVWLVDLGNRDEEVENDLGKLRSVLQPGLTVEHLTSATALYKRIHALTGEDDVVFTSLRGWRPWLIGEHGYTAEYPQATFLGPAALAAAYHGAPLLVTDLHPRLSAPVAWHNAFWQHAFRGRLPPSVGGMYLSGTMVYDFLTDHRLNVTGKESILTVAGQFTIGQAWDRMFPGVADAGRIFGTPVDTAAWVTRSGLYPALIWANPTVNEALDPHNGMRIMGSSSRWERGGPWGIVEPESEVYLPHNIAQSWVSYQHRFNQRAGDYWGAQYTGPAGITPYESYSGEPIDDDVNGNYGQHGMYYPDMTTSEVVPFYAERGGYTSVHSTQFEKAMENLNRGTLLWVEVMHGGHQSYGDGSGVVGFWGDNYEENPWRGYETGGATEETFWLENSGETSGGPDTITMSKQAGADLVPASQIPGPVYENHDGIIIAIAQQVHTNSKGGYDFDNALENIHSMGFNGGSCLIAGTYLHLTMMRHGSVFQVIDPWLTSWYCALAIELFVRGLAMGDTVGEAYSEGIHNVGIEYLTKQWWWDIFENVVYFGDPDLRMWSPQEEAPYSKLDAAGLTWYAPPIANKALQINGHAVSGAGEHTHAIRDRLAYDLALAAVFLLGAVGLAGAAHHYGWSRRAGDDEVLDAEQ